MVGIRLSLENRQVPDGRQFDVTDPRRHATQQLQRAVDGLLYLAIEIFIEKGARDTEAE